MSVLLATLLHARSARCNAGLSAIYTSWPPQGSEMTVNQPRLGLLKHFSTDT